ncbi:hypothetical protein [Xanthocytophaga flava]|uniref:hypothetical protein n=1 Tax=Xanthocytophaga flava TaxID=3048013 RepID=UPI0028D1F637|nr:hypothetical protein [Xanthocytophaga flavus]MDJ1473427.1 hypothetical protein [Xanthocytophaga flavus]
MKNETKMLESLSLFQDIDKQEEQEQDTWKKSIPAQVFLNHFFGMHYHIQHAENAYDLDIMPQFINYKPALPTATIEEVKKLLLNCWSTEYALRSTAELGNEQYLRNALHWTFPQAYYSVLFGLRAFLATFGIVQNNNERIKRETGMLVVKGYYPFPIAYYASGTYDNFIVHRLPLAARKPGLQLATESMEAQAQIGQFLRTTRKLYARAIRQQMQSNPQTALRNKKGEVLDKFTAQHWQKINWRLGYTTYFDLLERLRISTRHREIERFVEAEIDFSLFHQCLLEIVSYLNLIHESYIAKAVGLETYEMIVNQLPDYISKGFVKDRLTQKIEPLLKKTEKSQIQHAA